MSINWNIFAQHFTKTHWNELKCSGLEKWGGFLFYWGFFCLFGGFLWRFTFVQDQGSTLVLLRKILLIQRQTKHFCSVPSGGIWWVCPHWTCVGLCLQISCCVPDCAVFRMVLAALQKRSFWTLTLLLPPYQQLSSLSDICRRTSVAFVATLSCWRVQQIFHKCFRSDSCTSGSTAIMNY